MQQEFALVVAGGKGLRFGSSTPKQFLELNGKPVLVHTLEAFFRYSAKIQIVLVLPEEDLDTWDSLSRKHQLFNRVGVQPGGASRFQSVKKGLEQIPDYGWVAIHDGVRPLVTTPIIDRSFKLARQHGSAVAAVSLKESLRFIGEKSSTDSASKAVDRSLYRMIQTPQTFEVASIKKAYLLAEDPALTDDASVAERAGLSIHLFEGDYNNIKITTPEDLLLAEALLRSTSSL